MLIKVLYIPQLDINLISKEILNQKGYKIVKENNLYKISQKNELLAHENRENKLYIFLATVRRSNQVLTSNIDEDIRHENSLILSQEQYIIQALEKYNKNRASSAKTPSILNKRLEPN